MKLLSTTLAALGALVWLVLGVGWARGIGAVPVLRNTGRTERRERLPSVSVIVAARDEEDGVHESVVSMLVQDYGGELEVVAVDDRSGDRTGDVLRALERAHPDRLRVLRVDELPEGWLGKTHALCLGAGVSRGEWLLFTDADVRLSPPCLGYAVEYAARNGLHHLTLAPEIVSRGVLLRSFVAAFTLTFEMTQRPWRAPDPEAGEFVGVGAFNLVRRDVYEAIGTHRAIAMRPDDDMKLAKLVKKGGFRQGVGYGAGLVSVEWHRSLAGAVRGLSKSVFPGVDYRPEAVAGGVAMLFLTGVLPFAGVILSRGAARVLSAFSVLAIFAAYAYRERYARSGTPLVNAALHPVSVCVFAYAMLRSVLTILADGGIEWRGTRYPLEQLQRNAV